MLKYLDINPLIQTKFANAVGDYVSDYSLGLSTILADHSTDVYKGVVDKAKELGANYDSDSFAYTFKDKTKEEMIAIYDELIEYVNENFDQQDKHVKNWISTLSERRGKLNSDEYTNAQKALEDAALQRIAANDEAYEYYNQIQQAKHLYNPLKPSLYHIISIATIKNF